MLKKNLFEYKSDKTTKINCIFFGIRLPYPIQSPIYPINLTSMFNQRTLPSFWRAEDEQSASPARQSLSWHTQLAFGSPILTLAYAARLRLAHSYVRIRSS